MKNLIYIVLCLLTFSAKAQDSTLMLTLDKALELALSENVNVKNARIDQKIAQKQIWETTAIGLPQINGEGSFQNFIELPTTVIPANAFNPAAPADELVGVQFGTNYNVTGSITLSQLIFDGRYLVGLQASRAVSGLYKLSSEKVNAEVKKRVKQAYFTVLITQSTIETLEKSTDELQNIYKSSQIMSNEGVIETTEADQLSINLRAVENNLISAKEQLEIAKNFLKLEIGLPLEQNIQLNETLEGLTSSVQTISNDFSPSANINYLLMENRLTINRLSLREQQAFALPTLGGFFTHQQQAFRNEFDFFNSGNPWYPSTLWGLKLTVPIFSSGQRISRINQAKLEIEKAENELENLDTGLKVQYQSAMQKFNSAKRTLETEKKNLSITETILKNTEIKFKEGMASSMELSQAQSQHLNTKANYISAAYNLLNAQIELNYLLNK